MPKLLSSDAHYLDKMNEQYAYVELPERSVECLISALRGEVDAVWNRGVK